MLLSTVMIELGGFLRIISWILFPVLLISFLVTVINHYRQKRKNGTLAGGSRDEFINNYPFQLPDGAYAVINKNGMPPVYHQRLSFSQARFMSLKNDFESLESKYMQSGEAGVAESRKIENAVEPLEVTISRIANDFLEEKKELKQKIADLEKENKLLRERFLEMNYEDAATR